MKFCRKSKATSLFPEGLEIPRNAKRRKKQIAQPEDIKKLFSCRQTIWHIKVREDRYIHAYRIAILTGLRPGELLGLQWDDITEERLTIRRALKAWNRYCECNKLSRITPYEMRHTYVSVNDEMPDGLKKQALGHSANMDTEGVYGHTKTGDLDRITSYSDSAIKKIIEK